MRRLWRILEGTAFPFLTLGGNAGAVALVLAHRARVAILITACLPLLAGLLQARLAQQRKRRRGLRPIRRELRGERRIGRLCLALGALILVTGLFLPVAVVVAIALLGSIAALLRTFAVVADTAIREDRLKIKGLSAAQECSGVERWARRLTTMPGRLGKYLAKVARTAPPAGELTRLRALPVVLIATATLVFAVIGSALAAEEAIDGPGDEASGVAVEPDDSPDPELPTPDVESDDAGEEEEQTYAELCEELPDPLDIGHGIGALFRYDGAYKAGCGTEARQVSETGAWFAPGTCHGHFRSLGVGLPDGSAVLLYGAGARFAWQAALRGELRGAEVAHPAGGDVYSVETLAGSYGFARRAPSGGSDPGTPRDCTEVTSTSRPFAEIQPPMLLHWRNLVEWRAAWSWPLREDVAGSDALAFVAHPSGEVTARGACASELSCYLDVDGVRWPGDETAYVSLDELAQYMPPSLP